MLEVEDVAGSIVLLVVKLKGLRCLVEKGDGVAAVEGRSRHLQQLCEAIAMISWLLCLFVVF
jgi:hypothetical protein